MQNNKRAVLTRVLEILAHARYCNTPSTGAQALISNARAHVLSVLVPDVFPAHYDARARNSELWRELADVSGRDCLLCGLDSTAREIVSDGTVFCPWCAVSNMGFRICGRCATPVLYDTALEVTALHDIGTCISSLVARSLCADCSTGATARVRALTPDVVRPNGMFSHAYKAAIARRCI